MTTEEKDELFKQLAPLTPWKGTSQDLKKALNWPASTQSLSAQLRVARDHLAAKGMNIKRSTRKDHTTGGYTWHITEQQDHKEIKVLFDSQDQQWKVNEQEDTVAEQTNHKPTEDTEQTLGLKLVWEVSEKVLEHFFAVLPLFINKNDGTALGELTKLMRHSLDDHNTDNRVSHKETSANYVPTSHVVPLTQSSVPTPKKNNKGHLDLAKCVLSRRKDDKSKHSLRYRLRSTIDANPDTYIIVESKH